MEKVKKQQRMKTFYSTIIMNTLRSLGSNGKIQQLISTFLLNLSKDKKKLKKNDNGQRN